MDRQRTCQRFDIQTAAETFALELGEERHAKLLDLRITSAEVIEYFNAFRTDFPRDRGAIPDQRRGQPQRDGIAWSPMPPSLALVRRGNGNVALGDKPAVSLLVPGLHQGHGRSEMDGDQDRRRPRNDVDVVGAVSLHDDAVPPARPA